MNLWTLCFQSKLLCCAWLCFSSFLLGLSLLMFWEEYPFSGFLRGSVSSSAFPSFGIPWKAGVFFSLNVQIFEGFVMCSWNLCNLIDFFSPTCLVRNGTLSWMIENVVKVHLTISVRLWQTFRTLVCLRKNIQPYCHNKVINATKKLL